MRLLLKLAILKKRRNKVVVIPDIDLYGFINNYDAPLTGRAYIQKLKEENYNTTLNSPNAAIFQFTSDQLNTKGVVSVNEYISTGEIRFTLLKNNQYNDLITFNINNTDLTLNDTDNEANIIMVFGTPPEWWLNKYSLSSGKYIQIIIDETVSEIQPWGNYILLSTEFWNYIGYPENTQISNMDIYSTATNWL